MDKNKSKSTNSGLLSYTLKPGNGKKPKKGENIKLFYEGYFVDGKLFYSVDAENEQEAVVYSEDNPEEKV